MGALHKGHLTLIEKSLEDCDVTCVSIFVNPTQFNNKTDLQNYPRTLKADINKIYTLSKDVIIFAPEAEEIYPDGLKSNRYNFGELAAFMEGEYRAGHFDGVGTVLEKLFAIIRPDKAYFGEKDFQQLAIVKALVALLDLDIEIIGCETLREANGLAISSRNNLLNDKQKKEANLIYDSLLFARNHFNKMKPQNIKEEVVKRFNESENLILEYFEIASEKDLKPTDVIKHNEKYRGFIAAFSKQVRLIDNMALN
jgi:pantoate--beta-alanine ligase